VKAGIPVLQVVCFGNRAVSSTKDALFIIAFMGIMKEGRRVRHFDKKNPI
jgi:hypothetical protein